MINWMHFRIGIVLYGLCEKSTGALRIWLLLVEIESNSLVILCYGFAVSFILVDCFLEEL